MHYYQFNIADYRKDTVHLTPIEHYIYRTLIDWYYLDENPISTETQVVIRRLCLDFSLEQNLINVLRDFFVLDENGWKHKRINIEIIAYHEQCDKNRFNGNKGGRPKKTQVVAKDNPKEPNRNPNHKPLTNNQELIKPERKRSAPVTIKTFLEECKENNVERIPKDDPVFDFAEKNNIPLDMIRVCWQQFVRTNKETDKKQKDWRAAFRNCVRGNWYKLWFVEADGTIKETSQYRALKKDLGDSNVS